jgi:hypothetical protein
MSQLNAIITADVVNSTNFSSEQTAKWLQELILLLDQGFSWKLTPEVFRGDSFQGVMASPEQALQVALLSRAFLRSKGSKSHEVDIRVAIGIGTVADLTDRPGTSDGEAFRLSGRLADEMKKKRARIALAFRVPSAPINSAMDLLETIVGGWTAPQAEVITGILQKETLVQIAERLKVSQSALSQRIAASNWWAVSQFLETFPEHINLYTRL